MLAKGPPGESIKVCITDSLFNLTLLVLKLENSGMTIGQHHCCWYPGSLCHINMSLSSVGKDFRFLHNLSVERWQKKQIYFHVSLNEFNTTRVKTDNNHYIHLTCDLKVNCNVNTVKASSPHILIKAKSILSLWKSASTQPHRDWQTYCWLSSNVTNYSRTYWMQIDMVIPIWSNNTQESSRITKSYPNSKTIYLTFHTCPKDQRFESTQHTWMPWPSILQNLHERLSFH